MKGVSTKHADIPQINRSEDLFNIQYFLWGEVRSKHSSELSVSSTDRYTMNNEVKNVCEENRKTKVMFSSSLSEKR